jgi:hypothetical protein
VDQRDPNASPPDLRLAVEAGLLPVRDGEEEERFGFVQFDEKD